MTELDFEELDKAVNDLMQDAVNVSDSSVQDDSQAPVQSLKDPIQESPMPTAPAGAPLAVKRRGRFMDMVASGVPAKKPVIDNVVKREGITIPAPDSQVTANNPDNTLEAKDIEPADGVKDHNYMGAEFADKDNVVGQDGRVEEQGDNEARYAANPAPAHEWPEAQEVTVPERQDVAEAHEEQSYNENRDEHQDDAEAEHQPVADMPVEVQDTPSTIPAADLDNKPELEKGVDEQLATVVTPDEPHGDSEQSVAADTTLPDSVMTSPFLPDAKVEKRPLGSGDVHAEPVAPLAAAAPEMPRELSAELINLESADNKVAAGTQNEQVSQAVAPSAPVSQAQPQVGAAEALAAATAATTAGTIFDTETYHAPLKQPEKTKSGWLVVVWVLVLLIIGSLAGAAYYYFTMHQ